MYAPYGAARWGTTHVGWEGSIPAELTLMLYALVWWFLGVGQVHWRWPAHPIVNVLMCYVVWLVEGGFDEVMATDPN